MSIMSNMEKSIVGRASDPRRTSIVTVVRAAAAAVATLGLLAVGASEVAAHGEATLEASATSVRAGGTITLRGGLFVPGEAHRLVLRGTLADHELGTVTAGADSTFTEELDIPADVRPGNYRLVAVAPDGDEVATLDLPILAAQRTGASDEDGRVDDGADPDRAVESGAAPSREARADELRIDRSRAGLEWGVIGLVIGLAGGLGVGLLRRG